MPLFDMVCAIRYNPSPSTSVQGEKYFEGFVPHRFNDKRMSSLDTC